MRTGQSHRTLTGHTAPVTCVQFDELHIVSGSLDKTVKVSRPQVESGALSVRMIFSFPQVWDIRAGTVFETLKYDYPVTSLQFDTRKIVAATGENGIKVIYLLDLRLYIRHSRPSSRSTTA